MKKIILAATLILGAPVMMASFSSCSVLNAANGNSIQAIGKVANIANTAQEIAGVLGNTLGLNGQQKTSVTDIFTNYIGNTNGIASLFNSNKASYAKQLLNLNKGTLGKLNGILTAAQYAKLLGIGSNSNSLSSLIGGLSGGNSLSSDAKSVLGGLLLNSL